MNDAKRFRGIPDFRIHTTGGRQIEPDWDSLARNLANLPAINPTPPKP